MVNFHTHTKWCDGKSTVEEFLIEALQSGFCQLGFSSHAPLLFQTNWALMNDFKAMEYVRDVRYTSEKYNQIQVLCGLEADFLPGKTRRFNETMDMFGLDYIIGAVHLVDIPGMDEPFFIDGARKDFVAYMSKYLKNDGKKACMLYYEQMMRMVEAETFHIIAHLDKIKMNNANEYFREDEHWYQDTIMELLKLIKQKGIIIEINTRGLYRGKTDDFFPSRWIINEAARMEIPLLVQTDAHKTDELTRGMAEAFKFLHSIGYSKRFQWNEKEKKFSEVIEE